MWNFVACLLSPGQDKKRASVIYDHHRKKEEKILSLTQRIGIYETRDGRHAKNSQPESCSWLQVESTFDGWTYFEAFRTCICVSGGGYLFLSHKN